MAIDRSIVLAHVAYDMGKRHFKNKEMLCDDTAKEMARRRILDRYWDGVEYELEAQRAALRVPA